MIQESCVIRPINITRRGQILHFQVKLPQTAKRIIGVELGGFQLREKRDVPSPDGTHGGVKEPVGGSGRQLSILTAAALPTAGTPFSLPFKRNALVGELRLQSCEEANIFYTGHFQLDNNMAYLDYTSRFFRPKLYTHQGMAFEEKVVVDAETTTILGIYVDQTKGNVVESEINYQINVYIWYQS